LSCLLQISVTAAGQTATWDIHSSLGDIRQAWLDQTTVGEVGVTNSNHWCYTGEIRYYLQLRDHVGGISDLFEVDSSNLENVANVYQFFNRRGGAYMNRIPASYLTVPVQTDKARVVVTVNDEAAVCSTNTTCEFDFNDDITPKVRLPCVWMRLRFDAHGVHHGGIALTGHFRFLQPRHQGSVHHWLRVWL